jgi:hypothetical protein
VFVILSFSLLPLYCLSFDLRLLISLFTIVLSVLRFTASDFTIYHCLLVVSLVSVLLHVAKKGLMKQEIRSRKSKGEIRSRKSNGKSEAVNRRGNQKP